MTRRIPTLAAILVPTLVLSSGCDFIDQLTEHSGIVDVFATSHGTPTSKATSPTATASS